MINPTLCYIEKDGKDNLLIRFDKISANVPLIFKVIVE